MFDAVERFGRFAERVRGSAWDEVMREAEREDALYRHPRAKDPAR
jgi:hypothetical protein